MLRFEWNALRAGDHLLVHDPRTAEITITAGAVATVDTHKAANGVGIRIDGAELLWPSYLAVHRDPIDPDDPCWRCQELAQRAVPPSDSSRQSMTAGSRQSPRRDAAPILSRAP